MESDLTQTAINLARNTGWPVFPCREDNKRPCWGKHEGGAGFHDASVDPQEITRLFAHRAAGLIGIRSGEASGVSVLDIDVKHDSARAWWKKNEKHFARTRTYRTRGGGLHLYFQHRQGVRNSESGVVQGIDTRGEGGYAIHWFAHGFECLDHAPPAPWPIWLSALIWPAPSPITRAPADHGQLSHEALERVRETAIRKARDAGDGARHCALRGAAMLLGGIQDRAGFTETDAMGWLLDATGLHDEKKARDTITTSLAYGRTKPLDIRGGR